MNFLLFWGCSLLTRLGATKPGTLATVFEIPKPIVAWRGAMSAIERSHVTNLF